MSSRQEEAQQRKALLDILAIGIYNKNKDIIRGKREYGSGFENKHFLKIIRKRLS